jgi:predicted phosphate transport protein (TIGR00153 family)
MRFLPKDESFFDQFEKHGRRTVDGCRALVELVTTPGDMVARAKGISEIEHDCDRITHAVVAQLHKTFITPLDRNDIHRLITKMDDVMDYVEAAAERLALYELTTPTPEVGDMAVSLMKSAERVLEAVTGLRNLKNSDAILEKCVEINRLENETDGQLRVALARLFREEKDPILILKWKEIYELFETATDRCEDVANIIEGVVLENS